jgi:GT2 family glycosyltransferase/glycosyltransferase involved in cell wall biosynthesis
MSNQTVPVVGNKTRRNFSEEIPLISIVILNYNGQEHLASCLPSLAELNYPKNKLEIIMVDNASTDDSVSWLKQNYPKVRLLENLTNLGFAGGINSGARIASGSLLAFLNADMRVDKDWLFELLDTLGNDATVACAGSVVLNWTGEKIDYSGRPNDALNLCPSPPEEAGVLLRTAYDIPLLFASGGAMLIRREVFLNLGGFDEDFFLYNEDVDLGWRLWLHGYRVIRSTRSLVFHKGGASAKLLSQEFIMGMAQKYALYTLLKNMDNDQLWSILPGILWFLVDRSRWFTSARLSLGQAIRELIQEMDTLWRKRFVIQSERVRSDAEIFMACGHPFGFLFTNSDYPNFKRYLADNKESLPPSSLSADSISNLISRLFFHAYKFNYEQLLNQLPGLSKQNAERFDIIKDFNDLHYQFTKLNSKPLVRIAKWLEWLFPENSLHERLLRTFVNGMIILHRQGLHTFLEKVKIKKKGFRFSKIINSLSEENDDYFGLTPKIRKEILEQSSDHPPQLPDIIVLPFIDWEFRIQRPQQLAMQLAARGHRVFYFQRQFTLHQYPIVKQIRERLFLVQLPDNSERIYFQSTLSEVNVQEIETSFMLLRNTFNINSAVIVVDLPFWRKLAIHLREIYGWKIVYDCMDYHAGFSNSSDLVLIDEQLLAAQSDLVIASSHLLFEKVKEENTDSILVPNGTDFDFFHNLPRDASIPELKNLSQPIIGYYGAIADWFNTILVGQLATAHPEWSFILIGSTELADLEPIINVKNIILLGEKPYIDLPKYLSKFDVLIIPFKSIPLTNATNPVKLYEFLSAGKPVVATRLNEISYYEKYVKLAETQKEWEKAIQESLLEEKTPELLEYRYDFARKNTWQERAEAIDLALTNLFPKVSIVIVNFNVPESNRMCIESIQRCTEYPNYEIILVHNASSDDITKYVGDFNMKLSLVHVSQNNQNLSFAAAYNQGVKASSGEYIVFLNNDTVVTPGWLWGLYRHLINNPAAGMVGLVTNSNDKNSKIDMDYGELNDFNYYSARWTSDHFGQKFGISMLPLYCAIITRQLLERLGGLDERYQIGVFEDDDLAMKIIQAGMKLLCATDIYIHHFPGQSVNKEEYQQIFTENKIKFEKKWGVKWTPHQY